MGKNAEFLKGVLFEGGEVPESAVLTVSMNAPATAWRSSTP
jgi:hypothetical protein